MGDRIHTGALTDEPWDVFCDRLDDWQIAVAERFVADPATLPCDVTGQGLMGVAAYWAGGGADGIVEPVATDADVLHDYATRIRRARAKGRTTRG